LCGFLIAPVEIQQRVQKSELNGVHVQLDRQLVHRRFEIADDERHADQQLSTVAAGGDALAGVANYQGVGTRPRIPRYV